jgi:hypothetical protein
MGKVSTHVDTFATTKEQNAIFLRIQSCARGSASQGDGVNEIRLESVWNMPPNLGPKPD